MHAMKDRELVPQATFPSGVVVPQCMSMEEVLASLHHYIVGSHSHNLCLVLISLAHLLEVIVITFVWC